MIRAALDGTYLKIAKNMYDKPTTNINFYGEKKSKKSQKIQEGDSTVKYSHSFFI